MGELASALWPIDRLPDALEALSIRAGAPRAKNLPAAPALRDRAAVARWLDAAAANLGLEAEPVSAPFPLAGEMVERLGSGVVLLESEGSLQAAVTLGSRGKRVRLLRPDRSEWLSPPGTLRDLLCENLERGQAAELNQLLDRVGLEGKSRARARLALLRARLLHARVEGPFLLRLPPGAPPALLAKSARLQPRFAALFSLQLLEFSLWLLSWWVIGFGALQGRIDRGWLFAWALLRVTLVPLRMWITRAGGTLAIDAAVILKARLLAGALRLLPEEMRREGVGQLLARTLEAAAVEKLGFAGGLDASAGLAQLIASALVLGFGAGGGLLLTALAIVCAAGAFGCARHHRLRGEWTQARLLLTHDQVERMVGHRTRLAQEPRKNWHEEEDHALDRYLDLSRQLDRAQLFITAIPRAWICLAILALTPSFATFANADSGRLALSLLGALLMFNALEKLAQAWPSLSGAVHSFSQIAPLFEAAGRGSAIAKSEPLVLAADEAGSVILDARALTYRHRGREQPVLAEVNLRLRTGDRVLLQGRTGGGKSTLASLLCGLRVPDSGVLLLGGLDQQTLGAEGFRKRVACAPQFHDNHVLTGTVAFNLLMGRTWPARAEDLLEAEAICRELQLGPLLERMPAGLSQTIGETGWQLSHGEKSRLFIARALLQNADVVLLDESFAALDPLTLRLAMGCVLARAKTLLVIAHP